MRSRLLSIFALVAILFLNACKDDEAKLPANVIKDADGVTIELTWSTGSSTAQALEDADIDLFVYSSDDQDIPVGGSVSGEEFEELQLDEDYDDDEYSVVVKLFENYAAVDIDFVVTVSGGDKDIVVEGSFQSTELDGSAVSVVTIKKAGNKYTVDED